MTSILFSFVPYVTRRGSAGMLVATTLATSAACCSDVRIVRFVTLVNSLSATELSVLLAAVVDVTRSNNVSSSDSTNIDSGIDTATCAAVFYQFSSCDGYLVLRSPQFDKILPAVLHHGVHQVALVSLLSVVLTAVAPGVCERIVNFHNASAVAGRRPTTYGVQFTAQCAHVEQTALDAHGSHLPSDAHTPSHVYSWIQVKLLNILLLLKLLTCN